MCNRNVTSRRRIANAAMGILTPRFAFFMLCVLLHMLLYTERQESAPDLPQSSEHQGMLVFGAPLPRPFSQGRHPLCPVPRLHFIFPPSTTLFVRGLLGQQCRYMDILLLVLRIQQAQTPYLTRVRGIFSRRRGRLFPSSCLNCADTCGLNRHQNMSVYMSF